MGRGRAPCCDKSKVKKGPWSPAEDYRLISFIQKQGHDNWRALPQQAGLLRCGKSCRLRWINYLRPDVKRGNFTPEEEETIINLQKTLGNKWSKIASHLPGRTDNEIKNVWNTHLKKRLIGRNDASCHQIKTKDSFASSSNNSSLPSPSSSSCISYGDLNMEKGARVDQGGQESKVDQKEDPLSTMASGKNNSIDEPKEASTSPSHSNAPNTENFCQVKEALWPVEEVSSVDNNYNVNASWEVQKIMKEETNEKMGADGIIEIPLEPDADFWNMLDDFDTIDESSDSQPQMCEFLQTTNLGEDHQEDVEYREWLKYLENELELEGNDGDRPRKGTLTEQQHQQLVTKISENEMMLRPEFDPAMAYFSMWPSSP